MKKCSKCNEEKDYIMFSKNKNVKDGYSRQCKECAKKYYLENKEIIDSNNKNYYLENKENLNEKKREYYSENKEVIKEKQIEYYNNNKKRKNTEI